MAHGGGVAVVVALDDDCGPEPRVFHPGDAVNGSVWLGLPKTGRFGVRYACDSQPDSLITTRACYPPRSAPMATFSCPLCIPNLLTSIKRLGEYVDRWVYW